MPYQTALGLSSYLEFEKSYVPWSAALSNFGFLQDMFVRTAGYGQLRVRGLCFTQNIKLEMDITTMKHKLYMAISNNLTSKSFFPAPHGLPGASPVRRPRL